MNARRRLPGLSTRIVLLAVLLLAQGLLLAHEIDHYGASDYGLCAVCQVGHGLDSPAVAAPPPPTLASIKFVLPALPTPDLADTFRNGHRARAPPHALSD